MNKSEEVTDYILKLLNNKRIKGFYSSIIPKHTTATLQEAEEELEKMTLDGYLLKQHEVLCDNCLRVIDKELDSSKIGAYYQCKYCGKENQNEILTTIKYIKNVQI